MGNCNTKQNTRVMRSIKGQNDVDFKIFEQMNTNCDESQIEIISNCSFLERLITGLKYFNVMINDKNINKSKVSKEIFIEFSDEVYTTYLDDFVHFVKQHGTNEQLTEIEKELKNKYGFVPCNISKCNKLARHYRSRDEYKSEINNNNNNEDNNFVFYCDFYDKLHYNLFHLFEIGLRTQINENKENKMLTNDTSNTNFECVDKIFEKR
eukprot:521920_1